MGEKMQEGLLNTYLESGFFPNGRVRDIVAVWSETILASVVADAFMKNVTKADAEKCMKVCSKEPTVYIRVSTTGRRGYEYYNKLGYVPYVKINENAARTLEYAYDDWCIYRV